MLVGGALLALLFALLSSSLLVATFDNPLDVFFDLVPTGAALYAPVCDPGGEVVDFRFVRLNPAGQRLLGLPAQPPRTFREYYPHSVPTGIFALYCAAYRTGQVATYDVPYAGDGLDTFFRLVAQRCGDVLVVNFTDMADLPHSAVEAALRAAQAAEQLARAEIETQRQRLTEVLRQLPTQIATYHGPDHVYTFVNQRYQDYFPAQALLGRPGRQALPAAAAQGFFDLLDRVYQTGEPYHGVELPITLDFSASGRGQQLFINTLYHPLRNSQGEINGVLDFSYDVTEQVRARQQVQQLNQDLEVRVADATQAALALQADVLAAAQRQVQERETFYQVFTQTPAAISLKRGPEHRYVFVNTGYQALFPDRVFVGHTVAEALPETLQNGILSLLDKVYRTGEPYFGHEVPLPVPGPKGTRQAYYTFTSQAYREHGAIAGISTFAYEVTEQVLARQQREAHQNELQRIFEQAPVAIAVFRGPAHTIELANDLQLAIWDRTREQALGKGLFELLPEVVAQGFEQILTGVMATGQSYVGIEAPASFTRHGVREEIFVNFVHHPLREADGRISGVVAVITDTTEQVRARQLVEASQRQVQALNEELTATNQELLASNARLRRTNVDLDTFIYTASHDLKAPIANIEGLLALLRQQLPAETQRVGLVPRVLGMMQESVERFRLTIAQLTDLTRLQQVPTEPSQPVQLAAVIEAVRLDLAPLLEATDTQLTVTIGECETVQFAPQHLRSIVYNLLSNAVKYRHPDRVPQVQLRCRAAGQQVVLDVQDNGLGLSQPQQEQLFTLFQRLHAHVEGSGVGLYMVKRIVENAGGTLTVQSQEGVGSTFTVTFPA
ncbi:MAG: PAS domain S-box protein [Hymenobacter sp.]|nr:MAG: PAS domain S-box protein [Hymenobacter sp.]